MYEASLALLPSRKRERSAFFVRENFIYQRSVKSTSWDGVGALAVLKQHRWGMGDSDEDIAGSS
jgi:hypothetical protein